MNGSSLAVSATGTSSMSDSLIACQPRMEEPSKPKPWSKLSSVSSLTGSVVCCHRPGKVHEPQVDELHVLFLAELENVLRCHGSLGE